ncbi:hypothetical protein G7K_3111-t1 [Saitoella complicata NRRL Y-17804]|uniref:Uncharacterized protein n=1 Tax=Saitoella complicata (strain BCRC 22490 / CBS 7301 / JCM 7358 / NBRC 10748 / NRRL Y-17804) TaxID=698492 RepID=A0A0E9NHR9_SAICN|nr:hypothetical protein G7K_3111-t1 [Saitoella complicata NRRL Y-17804]
MKAALGSPPTQNSGAALKWTSCCSLQPRSDSEKILPIQKTTSSTLNPQAPLFTSLRLLHPGLLRFTVQQHSRRLRPPSAFDLSLTRIVTTT